MLITGKLICLTSIRTEFPIIIEFEGSIRVLTDAAGPSGCISVLSLLSVFDTIFTLTKFDIDASTAINNCHGAATRSQGVGKSHVSVDPVSVSLASSGFVSHDAMTNS